MAEERAKISADTAKIKAGMVHVNIAKEEDGKFFREGVIISWWHDVGRVDFGVHGFSLKLGSFGMV